MNLSKVQIPKIKISIRVVAVIIGILGIWLLYWATNTKIPEIEAKTKKIQTENKTLTQTEKNLMTLYENMEHYLSETERLHEETEIILLEFPTFMYLEDKILYADTLVKTDLKEYNLYQFSYGQSRYIASVSYGSESLPLELYSVSLSGKFDELTYTQVKEILDYGLTAPQRFVIESMNMAYNQKTGYLSGQFSFKTFFIPGQSTPYQFPQEVIDNLGDSDRIDDLFGAQNYPVFDEE